MSRDAQRLPAYYIPHGGGPWHVTMDDFGGRAAWQPLVKHLEELGDVARRRAKAILVVSAHWEERVPTLHFGKAPGMLYDYYGFPEKTYHLSWPAPGSPETARRVDELLRGAGFAPGREEERGYDHGTFVPMMAALPEAKIPVAQLSLVAGLDPETHLAIGRALAPLRDEGVLIVGSGMSYHNLRMFGNPRAHPASERFDEWLQAAAESPDPDERNHLLASWESAPEAARLPPPQRAPRADLPGCRCGLARSRPSRLLGHRHGNGGLQLRVRRGGLSRGGAGRAGPLDAAVAGRRPRHSL